MQPESLVKLVGSGNIRTVEEEWVRIVESPDVSLDELVEYGVVLAELQRNGRTAQAETLAWTTIEELSLRHAPKDVLAVAGSFLLAIGDCHDLRGQVTELYRSAYSDRQALDVLLGEAGIAGGRPVRRALRTLDVCLNLSVGDFLLARDEDQAARVDTIDHHTWRFDITAGKEAKTLGAVHLADRYEPASATDFRVLRRFAPDELIRRLHDDPVSMVVALSKLRKNRMDREELMSDLVPEFLTVEEWKNWWTRARAALKRHPHLQIERRAPYTITYSEKAMALEDVHLVDFEKLHDPLQQLAAIENYLGDCKAQQESPSSKALKKCFDHLQARAKRRMTDGAVTAGLVSIIARRVGEAGGIEGAADLAVELFRSTKDPAGLFEPLEHDALHALACQTLTEARPEQWQDELLSLLPTFPMASCDREAKRLVEAGRTAADFEPIVEKILTSPISCFEALLWLWDGPSMREHVPSPPPVTILSRILRALHDCRLGETLPKEVVQKTASRARTVLSARNYERFLQCLQEVEPAMAKALQTQIARSDSLGHAVRDDLLKNLRLRFPTLHTKPETPPWQREDVIFVTREGLARKHEELDYLVNVKMKENAQAIGHAAERGDLSENSEYKFALEERDLLRARLAQMNAEMAIARVINPDDISTDCIGIGTRAVFQRVSDGRRYEMTFVGPWESDLDKGWYNYKAPLAQKVVGARVGDVVEFDHSDVTGQYELVAIENALVDRDPSIAQDPASAPSVGSMEPI